MPRFAVVRFDAQDFEDGESVCLAACVARFDTEEQAEAYRTRRFGQDASVMVVED